MSLKVDIEPDWTARGALAKDYKRTKTLLEKCPALCRRYKITPDTPVLGFGCTSLALATTPHRTIKVMHMDDGCGTRDAWTMHQLSKIGKIPHVVRSYGVLRVPLAGIYIVRSERLHTNLWKYLRDNFNEGDAWTDDWHIMDRRETLKLFARQLKKAGLGTDFLSDGHAENVMFDRLNRPTWFDFSHYEEVSFSEIDQIPTWDESRRRIVQPSVPMKEAA